MWFDPDTLSKTKTKPLATFATSATFDEEYTKTARQSRKVAEVAAPLDSEIITDGLLSEADQQKILAWLAHIGEDDQETIAETIDRCKADPDALSYFVQRANGISRPLNYMVKK
jgi:hypothetical protein